MENLNNMMSHASTSELTIYRNSVDKHISKRISSSSEEEQEQPELNKTKIVNSSDEWETSGESNELQTDNNNFMIEDFIAEAREQLSSRSRDNQRSSRSVERHEEEARPGTSRSDEYRQREISPESRSNKIIRDAEGGKAKMYELPGEFRNFLAFEQQPQFNEDLGLDFKKEFVHSSMVDESYQLVGSHLDQNMQDRIIQGEYVDFSRLIPKDRILTADDNRYEMVVKDGKTYWVPAGNQEGTSISNFNRWEQAFRVYSDVYMRAYPHRSSELVQYCHLIHTASQSYTWKNVYMYDKDFRLHMARHPTCSWSIILQQAWVVRLKDRLKMNWSGSGNRPSDKKEICKRFN